LATETFSVCFPPAVARQVEAYRRHVLDVHGHDLSFSACVIALVRLGLRQALPEADRG